MSAQVLECLVAQALKKQKIVSIRERLMCLRMAVLPALIGAAFSKEANALPPPAGPDAVTFESDFFPKGDAPKVDLSRFEKADVVLPGTYRGDIIVNNAWRARDYIVFVDQPDAGKTQPCFDAASLTRYGLDLHAIAADKDHPTRKPIPENGTFCGPLSDYIPGASTHFDNGEQSLSLTVAQIYTRNIAGGYVDPSQWDSGVNAGVLNYSANVYRSGGSDRGGSQTSAYVGTNASLNIGSWHLFHLGTLNWSERYGHHFQNTATYLQHDIPALQSQVVVGDIFTTGQLLDSVRLRGVRVYSDDRMLPQSQRGYAPVVRGIAETSARVLIKQRGYTLKEVSVAPGPFVVDDLYPTGYGGDIDVEVIEADGRIKRFSIPFAATPQSLRAGQSRWDIAVGKVSDIGLTNESRVFQGTYSRGLSNSVTTYVGTTLATGYVSALIGGALNTKVGSFSLDTTYAVTHLPGRDDMRGNSLRLAYSKNFVDTGTNFSLATTRFSSRGYMGLSDAVYARNAVRNANEGGSLPLPDHERTRFDLTLSQSLGAGAKYGQVYFNGFASNYWGSGGRQLNFSSGYSNTWKSLTYSITAQRTLNSARNTLPTSLAMGSVVSGEDGGYSATTINSSHHETSVFLTVSIPLGSASRAPVFTAMLNPSSSNRGTSSQASVSGQMTQDGRLTYNASVNHDGGAGASGSVAGQYTGPFGNLQASYSQGSGYHQSSAGFTGAVVAHSGGVTLSPPTGDTIALIHAPDAKGAKVPSAQQSTVDALGYAVMPNLMPYQLNTVNIDPTGSDLNVEFKETSQNVAPRAGTVVRLDFKTTSGRALLIDSTLPDGRPIPFAAEVLDAQGRSVGVAGQASQIFVSDMHQTGELTVRWGDGADENCHIQVNLPPLPRHAKPTGQEKVAAPCVHGIGATAGQAPLPAASDIEKDRTTAPNEPSDSFVTPDASAFKQDEQVSLGWPHSKHFHLTQHFYAPTERYSGAYASVHMAVRNPLFSFTEVRHAQP